MHSYYFGPPDTFQVAYSVNQKHWATDGPTPAAEGWVRGLGVGIGRIWSIGLVSSAMQHASATHIF